MPEANLTFSSTLKFETEELQNKITPDRCKYELSSANMALIWQPHSATQAKIREAEDGNLNPANGRVFSGTHSQLLKDSRTLPVQSGDHCQVFLDNLKNHRVVVLTGATGSGKTTQVPRWAYSACGFGRLQADNLQIVVSQPRRLPSISVAGRVADEMDVKLGAEVGIKVRNYDRTDRKRTGMVFATDGTIFSDYSTPLKTNPDIIR